MGRCTKAPVGDNIIKSIIVSLSFPADGNLPLRFEEYCQMRFAKRFLAVALAVWLCCAVVAVGRAEYDMNQPQNLDPSHLYAESALLVDEDTGEVLFSKDSRVRMYPASTTKIMTLLLGLESGIALEDAVTIPAEAGDVPEGSSVVPVKPGDVTSFEDLLYGFMLSSGNDGANAVAVLVDGSIEAFVERMNRRAAEIGCEGTHYVNAHGYHDSEHYTTAQDLALIALEAMKNPDFRKIVAAPKWTMTLQRDGKTVQQEIVSRNTLLQSGEKYYYPDCTGIKTGHHNKAGWCFVGSAQRDGMRVICVVLKCEAEMSKWYDAARLFEYGFTRYERVTAKTLIERAWVGRFRRNQVENADPDDGGSLELNLTVGEGAGATVPVIAGSEASLDAAVDRLVSVAWTRDFVAPIEAGDVMGTVTCAVDGTPVQATLTASRSVAVKPEPTPTPTSAPEPTESIQSGESAEAPSRPVGHKGSGLVIMVILALVLAISAIAVVAALKRAERRRARSRRRRPVYRRGQTQGRQGNRPQGRSQGGSRGRPPSSGRRGGEW